MLRQRLRYLKIEPKLYDKKPKVSLHGSGVCERFCTAVNMSLTFHVSEGTLLHLADPSENMQSYRELRQHVFQCGVFGGSRAARISMIRHALASKGLSDLGCGFVFSPKSPMSLDKNQLFNVGNLALVLLSAVEYMLYDLAQRGCGSHTSMAKGAKIAIGAFFWTLALPCRVVFLPVALMNKSVASWRESTLFSANLPVSAKPSERARRSSLLWSSGIKCGMSPLSAVGLLLGGLFAAFWAEGRHLGFDPVAQWHVSPLPEVLEMLRPYVALYGALLVGAFVTGVVRALPEPSSNLRHFFRCARSASGVNLPGGAKNLLQVGGEITVVENPMPKASK
jgi:hypothetical protein